MKRIHIIHTGGTIGSKRTDNGTIDLIGAPQGMMTHDGCAFTESSPYHVLSENMSPKYWNLLINHIRDLDLFGIDALFIMHGTDTLAYSANLFSILFRGVGIPIFFISSHSPLEDPSANGHANMAAAIDCVLNFDSHETKSSVTSSNLVKTTVFVPYRGMDGVMRIHAGEKIMQSGDFSNDFYSIESENVNNLDNVMNQLKIMSGINNSQSIQFDEPLYKTVDEIESNILAIRPYPGINYDAFDISKVRAILHGTYHSFTATDEETGSGSLIEFAKRAADSEKKIFIAPMTSKFDKRYASLEKLSNNENIILLHEMSFEMAYVFLCLNR